MALKLSERVQEAENMRQRLGVDWPEMNDILCKLTTRGLLRFEGEAERVHIEPAAAQHAGSDYLLAVPSA